MCQFIYLINFRNFTYEILPMKLKVVSAPEAIVSFSSPIKILEWHLASLSSSFRKCGPCLTLTDVTVEFLYKAWINFGGKSMTFLFLAIKIFLQHYIEIFNIAQLIIIEATLRLEYFSCPIAFAIEGRRIPRKTKNNLSEIPQGFV